MPNYKYKCFKCKHEDVFTLPITTDPAQTFSCLKCDSEMNRVFIKPLIGKSRETLGKWFKEQTGKELLGGK